MKIKTVQFFQLLVKINNTLSIENYMMNTMQSLQNILFKKYQFFKLVNSPLSSQNSQIMFGKR